MRDRFFNLWYLMRGGRRQRRRLGDLMDFLNLFYRRLGSPPDAGEIVTRLCSLGLLCAEILKQAESETRRLAEKGKGDVQPDLFNFQGTGSPRVHLIVLCLRRQLEEAEQEAEGILRYDAKDSVARAVRIMLLERQGKLRQALEDSSLNQKRTVRIYRLGRAWRKPAWRWRLRMPKQPALFSWVFLEPLKSRWRRSRPLQ